MRWVVLDRTQSGENVSDKSSTPPLPSSVTSVSHCGHNRYLLLSPPFYLYNCKILPDSHCFSPFLPPFPLFWFTSEKPFSLVERKSISSLCPWSSLVLLLPLAYSLLLHHVHSSFQISAPGAELSRHSPGDIVMHCNNLPTPARIFIPLNSLKLFLRESDQKGSGVGERKKPWKVWENKIMPTIIMGWEELRRNTLKGMLQEVGDGQLSPPQLENQEMSLQDVAESLFLTPCVLPHSLLVVCSCYLQPLPYLGSPIRPDSLVCVP